MAMVVKNNMSAVMTLGVLNKNSSALAKSLEKVSTGMKVNSAADDNSGFAIAERMQVRVRALDQADQNTQNGANMLKVAEGSVSSTVDILRTMKEKAINAANDTNTDTDRSIIQKELDQYIDQIDDNALVTYNGKTLVDGSKMSKGNATRTALTNASLDAKTTGATALVDLQNRNGESLNILTTDKITVSYVIQGKNYSKEIDIDSVKTLNDVLTEAIEPYTMDSDNPQVRAAYDTYNGSVNSATAIYNAAASSANSIYNSTEASAKETYNTKVNSATTTYTQAISDADATTTTYSTHTGITLSAAMSYATGDVSTHSSQYAINSAILSEHPESDTAYWNSVSAMYASLGLSMNYSIYSSSASENSNNAIAAQTAYTTFSTRLSTLKSEAQSDYDSAVSSAATERDNKISTAASTRNVAVAAAKTALNSAISAAIEVLNNDLDAIGDLIPYKLTMEASNIVGKDAAGNDVYTADKGTALTITAAAAGEKFQLAGFTFNVTDANGQIKKSVNAVLDNFTESIRALNASKDNSITFQVDAKANQAIKIGLTDMRSGALGLKGSDGRTLSLATQENANAAVNVLDNALKKALDQQTDIGSIASRLEQTSSNLHIARDNVLASESTIRDADMAKEMTEYTKNNILLQASQSMLAQANQSSSGVLSLLQ
ncbi:flagellin N-terminal helical domain-containing protein [Selenomonas ruminantium]|uniref:Flagellin n=1 Tax=Selenomonas ruminantium TaxID=971 RepID=A0A1K1N8H6_SELRU|nr:flagellin [Selenomonas ruminantium]SFW31549.1 flagellin [Selenomonas ruminantium]